MTSLIDLYLSHAETIDALICVCVFLGLARIAFWQPETGFHLSGPLVAGLGCLLTIALIAWAAEHDYRLLDLGPLAAFIVIEAVAVLIINAAVRTR